MKIIGSQYQQITKMYQKKKAQSHGDTDSPKGDQVNLSREGQELKRVYAVLNQTPNVRSEKVQQLKQSIQQGTYEIKGEQIADKILSGHLLDRRG